MTPGALDTSRLVECVDGYCRRVYPAVLAQHERSSICSPLGIWLLLAALASAADEADRAVLEEALGCPAEEATTLLSAFMEHPPSALGSALALWVSDEKPGPRFEEWSLTLPEEVERGGIPSQEGADDWARRHTFGLIQRFPVVIDLLTRLVIASALATKVSWKRPFEVVEATGNLAAGPWDGQVDPLLFDPDPTGASQLVITSAAGVVAAHLAVAEEDIVVLSVSAEPGVARGSVLEAAHEVSAMLRRRPSTATRCSLFDLPLGQGHSFEITEREILTYRPGEREEQVESATLPAWRASQDLDLKRSETFGALTALNILLELIGRHPGGDVTEAKQRAVASYTRYGFEAAAVSVFAIALGGPATSPGQRRENGILRTARLLFDHPHAAIALAGNGSLTGIPGSRREWFGLPLFTAWVESPQEVEQDGAGRPANGAPGA
jgi:Serpin (serine protease inhibitor)